MRRPRERFNEMSNLAFVLAAALHTAGDIRTGASLQSGHRDRSLHDRSAGLRGLHLLHDFGKKILHDSNYGVRFRSWEKKDSLFGQKPTDSVILSRFQKFFF